MNKPVKNDSIVLITDPRVLAIPIKECGEEPVDLQKISGIKFGPSESPEVQPYYTIFRKSVYQKLLSAQDLLPKNMKLRLYEAYRNPKIQQMQFEEEYRKNRKKFPSLTDTEIFLKTTELVSPVINLDGTQNVPAHSTGGAFDIELIDESGTTIDMGMQVKDWAVTDLTICRTDSELISDEAKRHRKLLMDCLTQVGFVNYPTEWWHWSYGDRYWAYHAKQPYAVYGALLVP